jgi:hypothetical protein
MAGHEELVREVEELTLDPRAFDHRAHVRLAFAYLERHELFEALTRCRRALRRLAEHHGAHGKYHETVTCALVFLIHERMRREPETTGATSTWREGSGETVDWDTFARVNPDLLRWKDGAFFDYYPASVLRSELARETFVLPRPHAGKTDS